jgi:hypothetical protein
MNVLNMQSSQSFCYFLPRTPKYSPQRFVLFLHVSSKSVPRHTAVALWVGEQVI